MIEEPEPTSTELAPLRLPRAAAQDAVEGVRRGELVAHLVRHVVDGEVVADRGGQAGAAARLVVVADAGAGDAAARVAHRDVADVVGARADDLADHVAVAVEHRAARVRRREARRRAARAVGLVGERDRVEVELVVVADQDHPDRRLVLVDLGDAVDQGDLGRGHVGAAAVVGGVARVRGQREPEGVQLDLGPGERRGRLDLGCELLDLLLDEALVVGEITGEVADVDAVVALVVRVDEVGALGRAHRRVEAEPGDVGADRR